MRRAAGSPATLFRVVALAEAASWAGLLLGMLLKYGPPGADAGVALFGPVHGALFLLYVVVALATWRRLRWSAAVGATALLAAVPPLATWAFERWALRTGRLEEPEVAGTDPFLE
ncbi:DUF3817 domain-containing protein [Miltoncostaea marina]|uniref:DUF3817 domain-containing protein n=1 Tax=Miltoncostaea marina TaxID=2843215 RepID=UPI001C3E5CF7|nr:DUF3817 domain-containing protein [Miltoncostaea marina]